MAKSSQLLNWFMNYNYPSSSDSISSICGTLYNAFFACAVLAQWIVKPGCNKQGLFWFLQANHTDCNHSSEHYEKWHISPKHVTPTQNGIKGLYVTERRIFNYNVVVLFFFAKSSR